MKRFHVHVAVADINQSIHFYSTLFASDPAVRKLDYAKWMLDDPRVNFAISQRSSETGVRHLGIQVDDTGELAEVCSRFQRADRPVLDEGATTCCYAKSEKSWIEDPQGLKWEAFLTNGESTTCGSEEPTMPRTAACCEPPGISSAAPSRCCA